MAAVCTILYKEDQQQHTVHCTSVASVYIWLTQPFNPTSGAKQLWQRKEEQQQQPVNFML